MTMHDTTRPTTATRVTHHDPVRSDLAATSDPGPRPARRDSRAWAWCGVAAFAASVGGTVASIGLTSVYDPALHGDAVGITEDLAGDVSWMIVFHVAVTLTALLLVPFGAGLFRRLRRDHEGIAPAVAAAGVVGTAVVGIMATALDTEFIFAALDTSTVVPEMMVIYNHWLGTVTGCWVLTGLTGLALHVVARGGGAPRWIGRTGLLLGGLTLLVGIAPLQYMAGLTGGLLVLVTGLGFALGDRRG